MNIKQYLHCLLTITILLCALTSVRTQEVDATVANPPGENVVLQWNRVLQETLSTPGQHPATIFQTRPYAMMHAAIYDAVNSIDGTHTPYIADIPRNSSRLASQDAAAAQAAHDVLVALYPTRASVFATELNTSLNGIPGFQAFLGIRVGRIAAEQLLAVRANDGWLVTPPPYVLPMTPGNWQLAPGNTIATFTHYPGVLPFAIGSATRFASNPPPAMTSDEYTRDFNEVKALGSATSTTRTADQTQVARLWAGVNTTPTLPFAVYNNVARTVAIQRNLTTAENARLFALLNISSHDALQTTFAGKFQYGLWRPVTAIRRADEDGNPDTE
ncbi:MAG: vanadium-dependent haloperoxidase, partial [Acidobacteria bacterium]|nr:vanadium-dependent haloperoxidase [Acidobacteriota bacterium]